MISVNPSALLLRVRVLAVVAVAAFISANDCAAQTVAEVGDAGQTISTYQNLVGTGILTTITGEISVSGDDADLFSIYISNPTTFSVTTSTISGSLGDTQLFLFRLDGTGILANDDTFEDLNSQFPAGNPILSGLTPGVYLLGISGFDNDPYDAAGNLIFQSSPYEGVYGPTEGVGILHHWGGSDDFGTYTITLTGASFVSAIPEPATTVLLQGTSVLLAVGCVSWRRRVRGKVLGRLRDGRE